MVHTNILFSSIADLEFFTNIIVFISKYYNICIGYTSVDSLSLFLYSSIILGSFIIILESSKATELATKAGMAILTGVAAGVTKSVVDNKVFKPENNTSSSSNSSNTSSSDNSSNNSGDSNK